MSVTLAFETDDGTRCPYRFLRSDGRRLAEFCIGADESLLATDAPLLARLAYALGLDLSPLGRVAEPDLELEEFAVVARSAADAERLWREHLVRAEEAWQPPAALAACIRALVRGLDARPAVLGGVRTRAGVPADAARYYIGGGLRADLADLLLMADWADACGIRQVRLVAR